MPWHNGGTTGEGMPLDREISPCYPRPRPLPGTSSDLATSPCFPPASTGSLIGVWTRTPSSCTSTGPSRSVAWTASYSSHKRTTGVDGNGIAGDDVCKVEQQAQGRGGGEEKGGGAGKRGQACLCEEINAGSEEEGMEKCDHITPYLDQGV